MSAIRARSTLAALSAFALVLAAAPAMAAAPVPGPDATPAVTPVPAPGCGPMLPDLSIATGDAAASPLLEPLPQAIAPHCCTQQDRDACTAACKAIFPGCKGLIGCRAGECVCTCDCP